MDTSAQRAVPPDLASLCSALQQLAAMEGSSGASSVAPLTPSAIRDCRSKVLNHYYDSLSRQVLSVAEYTAHWHGLNDLFDRGVLGACATP